MKEKKEIVKLSRRQFIKVTGTACAAFLMADSMPSLAKIAFGEVPVEENIQDVLKRHFGDRKIETAHVDLKAPIIAENGAVVPITVTSDLPMEKNNYVKKIYIYAEGNLQPYVASVELTPANGKAELALRIKMRKTSNVRAVLETNTGKLYQGVKSVKVTIGGCGG